MHEDVQTHKEQWRFRERNAIVTAEYLLGLFFPGSVV